MSETESQGQPKSPARLPPAPGSALVWSSDYPKHPGLFWMRYHGQKKEIVSLTGEPGNLKQMFYGERIGLHNLPKDWGWQWSGPISEPQEPNAPGSATGRTEMNATKDNLFQEQKPSSLHPVVRRTVRFTPGDAQRASESWRFNCGPAALCAVLAMTPDELRPHMLDFEDKGYTNPTLMRAVLNKLGVKYKLSYRSDDPNGEAPLEFGLLRIQWAGPWTKPGVPMRARYRQTHWIACAGNEVFDVNAMEVGGWIPWMVWVEELVPWIIQHCCPKEANGAWWPTHALEVTPNAQAQARRANP